MRDALPVRLVERVGDLGGDLQGLVERERALFKARGERLAVEMRHHQVVSAVDAADVVNTADVRMVQGRDGACLALETRSRKSVSLAGSAGEDLDGDGAIEPRVPRSIDFTHAARPKGGEDLVRAEAGAGVKCQYVHRGLYERGPPGGRDYS